LFRYILLLSIAFIASTVEAKPKKITPNIQHSKQYSSCIVNLNNKKVLYARNADKKRYPASLTKMMTLYLTFEALKKKKIYPLQKIKVSKNAAKQPRSNINLKKGQKITIRKSIHALIVKSANDASVVLADAIAGNEKKFVALMNKKAKALRMYHTHFTNSNGLHNPKQFTTARDMMKLAVALRNDFPRYFHLFSMTSFSFKGRSINGHNHVLRRYHAADGLKTGYVKASGFNLVTSTNSKYGRLIGVVMGGQTARIRDDHMITLLDKAYKRLGKKTPKNNRKKMQKKKETKKVIKPSTKSDHDIFQFVAKEKNIPASEQLCWDALELH
jgi:D-alanyl-D-alanine carboxypeptidase